MAYSLTVAGYTFENPPEEYRKLARLSNSPQTAFNRRSTAFFQSDSQDLQLQVEGTLALDPPLGEPSDDLDELERLQEIAIEGGEVEVEFDPFFSGNAVIEDDPFRQSDGESSYQFTFSVNSEDTDDTAYPSHSTPDTGNTFELGDLDLGYDPSEVSQNYERQTEKVKRLQGIARTVDTEGLIPKVTISGLIDGGGQAELWDKARQNTLAYLNAEFQNGWVLMDTLSIRNAPEAPDYLTGLFRYDLDILVVMDPASGIGEVSKYVDQEVKDSTEYVSNCDEDGVLERLGDDTEAYPYALDFRVSGGTGKLNGEYLEWQEDYGTLDQSTTNYIWVEDPDGNGYGQVNTGTSGFPGNSVPLYEVDTSTSSVDAIRDQRVCLTGSRLEPEDLGDLNFLSDLSVDDRLDFERVMALPPDQMAVSDPIERWLGLADLTETLSVAEGPLDARAIQSLPTESPSLDDGVSATGGGGGVESDESISWGEASDWDAATSEQGVVHDSFGDLPGSGTIQLGFPANIEGHTVGAYFPLDEDSGSTASDATGNGNDATYNGPTLGTTGLLDTTAPRFNENNSDYLQIPHSSDVSFDGAFTIIFWLYEEGITKYPRVLWKDAFPNSNTPDKNYGFYWHTGDNFYAFGDGNASVTWDTSRKSNEWRMWALRLDPGSRDVRDIWTNGSVVASQTGVQAPPTNTNDVYVMAGENSRYMGGKLENLYFVDGYVPDSTLQDLYDATSSGYLTSAQKTFSSSTEPDLEALSYALNGQAIDVDVVGSPGTAAEESHTVTLDGSSSYTITWQDSHDTFHIRPNLSTTDVTTTPNISAADLTGEVITGDDSDQNPNTAWEILGSRYDTSGNEYEGGGVISRYGG
ncbi:hypothetical protein HHTV1_36 [Haloarcula hispanica tailed virus 1]|uniref:Concanavalin A-like lectin/glucanases superfamily protein n=1 Tax=Haloarcula hispanica tailed virus 1 TaxID=1273750 RepID=R4TGC8_9CAUD|nr:hypothetical protein M198_gp36 [Haloarcula hispanica tailed virus 1]AGM11291.1 hypothetical protein HHTV1_36 [Haloarcula hispanica tailed virus 1]